MNNPSTRAIATGAGIFVFGAGVEGRGVCGYVGVWVIRLGTARLRTRAFA